jgi:uncharacterized protein (DUF427 family)
MSLLSSYAGGMRARWNGQIVADSPVVREVGGYRYFPRSSVRMELLQIAPRTASDLECPHGVQFFDLESAGARSPRAAWSYEAPKPSMQSVDHWIGFWRDVELVD